MKQEIITREENGWKGNDHFAFTENNGMTSSFERDWDSKSDDVWDEV